jgi:release factor glutamine methyltransferase
MNANSSTTNKWLQAAQEKLKKAGISTARLDCLVLLEDATGKDRSYLLAHPELEIKGTTLLLLESQIERRAKHEPLAYIRGKSEFYRRDFLVNKHTLEPRPETETLVTLLKQLIHSYKPQKPSLEKSRSFPDRENVNWLIVDVGTGSGCVGITVKLEVPGVDVCATDVSAECLEIAKKNADRLKADMQFYKGNLLEPAPHSSFYLPPSTFAIVANLPYVPNEHTINKAAMQEPKLAIFGGTDGLDLYRQLFKQLSHLGNKPLHVLTESLPFQHKELANIAKGSGYRLTKTEDFIQVFRLSG